MRKFNKETVERINSFLKAHAKKCAYCGKPFLFGEGKTIDHISPQSRGLDESAKNKVVCCQDCNSRKSDVSLKDFRKQFNKENMLSYLEDFGDIQLPTGELYSHCIKKRLHLLDS